LPAPMKPIRTTARVPDCRPVARAFGLSAPTPVALAGFLASRLRRSGLLFALVICFRSVF
jgi:hypothetical protein